MNSNAQVARKSYFGRTAISLFVGIGPVASIIFLTSQAGSSWLPSIALVPALISALIIWSPMPLSIPALIMQDARDAALPTYRGVVGSSIRAFKLTWHLMSSPASPIRTEMTASVLGFALAIVVALLIK